MIWLGGIIGFCVGVVFITLCYSSLVEKVNMLEQKITHDQALLDDAMRSLKNYERDLEQLQRLVPPEIYALFFDAPYRN